MKVRDITRLWYTETQRQKLIANEQHLLLLNRQAATALFYVLIRKTKPIDAAQELQYLASRIVQSVSSCNRIIEIARSQGPARIRLKIGSTRDGHGSSTELSTWAQQDELCTTLAEEVTRANEYLQSADERLFRRASSGERAFARVLLGLQSVQRALSIQEVYLSRWTKTSYPKIIVEYPRQFLPVQQGCRGSDKNINS